MVNLFGTLVATFLMAGLGWLARWRGLLRKEDAKRLNSLVINFTLPAWIFLAVVHSRLDASVWKIPFVAWATIAAGGACVYLATRRWGLPWVKRGTILLAAVVGNTGFLGFPLVRGTFGEENLIYAIFYDQLGTAFPVLTLGAFLAALWGEGGEGGPKGGPLRAFLRFPPLWGMLLGLSLHLPSCAAAVGFLYRWALSWGGPAVLAVIAGVRQALEEVGGLTVPLVMMALGLALELRGLAAMLKPILLAAAIKLVLSPLVATVVSSWFGMAAIPRQVVILEAGMPTMMVTLSLAIQYGLEVEWQAQLIAGTLVLSLATIPLLRYLSLLLLG